MEGRDVNRVVLDAVLHIVETWVEQDRVAVALTNGVMVLAEKTDALRRVETKRAHADAVLAEKLPSHAYANVTAGLRDAAPRSAAPVGDAVRAWSRPDRRLEFARTLLAAGAQTQMSVERREEAARRAAEESTSHLAAEAERLAALEVERVAGIETEVRRRADRAASLAKFRTDAFDVLDREFLAADNWFDSWDTGGQVSVDDFRTWKAEFVQGWARRALRDDKFDVEQARAVATTSNDLRLVARAGSGKTRTIVTRALFLQLHCRVDPGEVLLVAFNRKAVDEISARLRAALPPETRLPHVVTFHALAYALLRPDEELVFDDEDAESFAQSRKVQDVVDDLLIERPDDVRRAMLGFFTEDWKTIERRGLHLMKDEFLASRAETTRVTLGGEYVKSFGERQIANVLFEHDVTYRYERHYTPAGFNLRPDFTIMTGRKPRVVIEYFGLMNDPQYRSEADKKRTFWSTQRDVLFVDFTTAQLMALGEDGFRDQILAALTQAGIPHRRLNDDEIWERARKRAIDTFSKTIRNVVSRARQLAWTADDLRTRTHDTENPDESVTDFLVLAADVYEEYLVRSHRDGFEDFSGLMWRAAAEVRNGQTTWTRAAGKEHGDVRNLRFIHVDEFQDFSMMFMQFIEAIRSQTPAARLCCVGDDWQAINGFAGADLRFFEHFESDFPTATTLELVVNYRSGQRIVTAGNTIMVGHGEPARSFQSTPGTIQVARLTDFEPSITEQAVFQGDVGTPALLRLIKHGLAQTTGVVTVLLRRKTVPWFTNTSQGAFGRKLDGYLKYLQGHFSDEDAARIDLTTAHKYKGREADLVIVADADARSYPLIHPTAELFEVFGDTIESLVDADRRLFYVATTRAASTLCYLVTTADPSPFLGVVGAIANPVQWTTLPTATRHADARVEVRVYDAYEVRDTLKDTLGFQFEAVSKAWITRRPAAGFDFDVVCQVLAFVGTRLIEARDDNGVVIHQAGARTRNDAAPPF